jgi:catechol-2,3-dioxygenase
MKASFTRLIIFAQNVDRLKEFYIDKLNLQLIEETKSAWVLLKAGSCEIGLHKIGDQYLKGGTFKIDNNTKVVFEIDEDLHISRERLIEKSVALKEIMNWDSNYWLCDGKDPEGNVFQLRQRRS